VIQVQKKQIELHLRLLAKGLSQIKKDADHLCQGLAPKKNDTKSKLSLLLRDGIEELGSELNDLEIILRRSHSLPKQKTRSLIFDEYDYDDN